jgi:hypothetical protein
MTTVVTHTERWSGSDSAIIEKQQQQSLYAGDEGKIVEKGEEKHFSISTLYDKRVKKRETVENIFFLSRFITISHDSIVNIFNNKIDREILAPNNSLY